MKNFEQELKLQLDEREYNILADYAKTEPQLQTNYYFCYPDMPADVMVRVRNKGGKFLLCYKRRLSAQDNVTVCDERECPISAERFGYIRERGVSVDEMRKLLGVNVCVPLRLAGKLDTYRTTFGLLDWNVELDKNVYLGRTDYELECENNDVAQLKRLKDYLYFTFGITEKPSKPKSQRFFEEFNK